MLSVASVIRIGFNSYFFLGDIYLPSLCLLAGLLLRETSHISHLFLLRRFQTVETIPFCKSRNDGADSRYAI